jgi:integrase
MLRLSAARNITAMTIDPTFHALVSRVRGGQRLVLLAGAGISAGCVRTGEKLTEHFNAELRKKLRIATRHWRMLSYSTAFRKAIPQPEDRRAFIEAECIGRSPQSAHLWVAQLLKYGHLRAVVTPNFDHLIEHGMLKVGCKAIPLVLDEDELHSGLWRLATQLVIKIHGDFLFKDIANLTSELKRKLEQNMRNALLRLTEGTDLLVVGYSGERAGVAAGLAFKVHPHMLRHACGYALANAGHDTRSLQAYLGTATYCPRTTG